MKPYSPIARFLGLLLCLLGQAAWAQEPAAQPQQSPQQAALQFMEQTESLAAQHLAQLLAHRDEIIGLELIVAEAPPHSPIYSRWGHTLLHFVSSGGDWTTDAILGFEALVPTPQPGVFKGLFGGYGVLADVETFGDFWNEYVGQQDRPLSRYVIASTPELRAALLETLSEWAKNPGKYLADYTFLDHNCATLLEKLMKDSGFPVSGAETLEPDHVSRYLWKAYLDPFPVLTMTTPQATLEKAATLLGITLAQLNSGADWPADSAAILERGLGDLEIKRLVDQCVFMPSSVRAALLVNHRYGNGGATLEQVLGYQSLPADLYQLCDSAACSRQTLSDALKIWSSQDLKADLPRISEADDEILHPTPSVDSGMKGAQRLMEPTVPRGPLNPFEKNLDLFFEAEKLID